jgi:hypothetical protein
MQMPGLTFKLNSGKATTDLTPCERLSLAQIRFDQMMSGRVVSEVETPQLGRVQFSGTADVGELRRYIESLKKDCAASLGIAPMRGRGPISVEVDP